MNPVRIVLTILAAASSIAGIVFSLSPTPGVELLKSAFPALLLASTFVEKLPLSMKLTFIRLGLALCIPADYVLGQLTGRNFYLGMALFAAGYLMYFLSTRPGKTFPILAIGLGVFSLVQIFLLGPQNLSAYLTLVPYLAIITLMAAGGWSEYLDNRTAMRLLAALGFTFLYISDSMIGHDNFGPLKLFGTAPILLTYLFGQTLVTLSAREGAV